MTPLEPNIRRKKQQMAHQFLFVPSVKPTDTQEQKELRYAASKAHISRNVHRKRRENVRRGNKRSSTEPEKWSSSRPPARYDDTSNEYSVHEGYDRNLYSPNVGSPDGNKKTIPISLCGNSDPFACQLIEVTPVVNQAASFARFHLAKSWSPSFMLRLVSNSTQYCPLLGCHGSLIRPQSCTLAFGVCLFLMLGLSGLLLLVLFR